MNNCNFTHLYHYDFMILIEIGEIAFFYCINYFLELVLVIFWPKSLFRSSSVGRAADFGSGGPNDGGLLKGQGSKFFFLFFS